MKAGLVRALAGFSILGLGASLPLGASLALGVWLMMSAPALAHHAVQASVDVNKTLVLKATLTRIDWINPHTWMHFDVKTDDGVLHEDVLVESLGISALRRVGLSSKSAFRVGDIYEISFYPNRDGSLGGFMNRMVLPDGRAFDTKNTDPAATQ